MMEQFTLNPFTNLSRLAVGFVFLIGATLAAQEPEIVQELEDDGATIEVYKTTTDSSDNEVELNIYIFNPEDHQASDQRAAAVFFFGGGWNGGTPTQFKEHCKYLANRGMVAMTADYRVRSRHGTKAVSCVSDAKSAVRWIRENAKRLGVDPNRIAAGGGSAGGHVAACTGVIKEYDAPDEDLNISSIPNALVLFNPALVLAPVEGQPQGNNKKLDGLKKRVGADSATVSPYHQLTAGVPPTIVFHGKADKTVPHKTAVLFTEKMNELGNRCELESYDGAGHGFFNFGRKNGKSKETVETMDRFLVSLGFLEENKKTANEKK